MSTVYTYNNKVLKNSANDKWLAKKEAPVGFVMNASNATISDNIANWEGPNYPGGYNGEGKTLQLIVKEELDFYVLVIQYANSINAQGPGFVGSSNGMWQNPNYVATGSLYLPVGTYNLNILNNPAGGDYGKYITLFRSGGPDNTIDSTWLSKFELRIID